MNFSLSSLSEGLIFFVYGLAFFSMGLTIFLEKDRSSDKRLGNALLPLAAFGVLHGFHEWMVMLEKLYAAPIVLPTQHYWAGIKIGLLALSFIALSTFGFSLLAPNLSVQRITFLAPLLMAAVWGFGILILKGQFSIIYGLLKVADVWTRYSLGILASLVSCIGLISQQRTFRHLGLAEFGRDSLIAAVAFLWYGIVGQVFVQQSRLFPSVYLNEEIFLSWFHFPIQILRAGLAMVITIFVIRFMRAFDAETQRQIMELQADRLEEAHQKEIIQAQHLKKIVNAQEAERQRIARELHDETGQRLSAIGLGLKSINSTFQSKPDIAKKNLEKLQGMNANAIKELQRIIRDLRPSHLDDLGLVAALRWYATQIQGESSLRIRFVARGEIRTLPQEIETAIFRIAQEGLTNILKHADTGQATICICYEDKLVNLSIQDKGQGFDILKINTELQNAWGLLGIRERTFLLDGIFHLFSEIGYGTHINVYIPYPGEELPPGIQGQELTNGNKFTVGGRSCGCEVGIENDPGSE